MKSIPLQFQKLIAIVCLALILFGGCANEIGTSNQSDSSGNIGQPLEINTAVGSISGNEYSISSGPLASGFDASLNFVCGNQSSLQGSILISSALQIVWHDTCSITFNSITYGGITYLYSGTGGNIINNLNPGNLVPVYISFQNGFTLQITTNNLYNVTATSGAPSITLKLITQDQATVVNSSANYILPTVGAGNSFTCSLVFANGIPSNGAVHCWGQNAHRIINSSANKTMTYLTPQLIINNKTLKTTASSVLTGTSTSSTINAPIALAVGEEFYCVLDSSQNIWCSGGYLDGTRSTALTLNGLTPGDGIIRKIALSGYTGTIKNIYAGSTFACAVTTTSQIWCWGTLYNLNGSSLSVRHKVTKPFRITWNILTSDTNIPIKKIAIGNTFFCAIAGSDSYVQCVGDGSLGQIGYKGNNDVAYNFKITNNNNSIRKLVNSANIVITGVNDISASGNKVCATTSTATYCWGSIIGTRNLWDKTSNLTYFNILGLKSPYTYGSSASTCQAYGAQGCSVNYGVSPILAGVTSVPPLSSIQTGMGTVCGIRAATAQYLCWGVDTTFPESFKINNMNKVVFNYVYGTNAIYNYNDSQTNNSQSGGYFTLTPLSVYSISVGSNYYYNATTLTPDYGQVCAVLTDNSIRCWGGNSYGQVGNNSIGNYVTTPQTILSPSGSGLGGLSY